MRTEVKKIDSTKREILVEVTGEIVKNKFEDVFKRIAKDAKVPGFRPGNAPRDILEKHYSVSAHEQVLKELVPDVYNEAVAKENLDVIELPEISDVKLDREKLAFKAIVEVSPEINVKNYKGIKIEYRKVSVSPEEVKRSLDSLKESQGAQALDDNFAKALGYPNLNELEAALTRQVSLRKDDQQRRRIEDDAVEAITKDLNFQLPASLVKRQLDDLTRHAKVDLAMKGMPREKIDEQEAELKKSLQAQAEKQVKVYLVLSAIGRKENIASDDQMPRRVMEFLFKEAEWKEVE